MVRKWKQEFLDNEGNVIDQKKVKKDAHSK